MNCALRPRTAAHARVLALVLACGLAAASQTAAHPRARFQFSTTSALVVLPLVVTGPHGRFISGLPARDFQVYEDGRRQKLALFEEGNAPISVAIVVDRSGSMAGKSEEAADAIAAFAWASDSRDQILMVEFNDHPADVGTHHSPFWRSRRRVLAAAEALPVGGETALYDAVDLALRRLRRSQWRRRALVILSDGGNNAGRLHFRQVLARARRSWVTIYAIGLLGAPGEEENPGLLKRLCRATGGVAYFPHAPGAAVEAATAAIAGELRQQYTLGYVPGGFDGGGRFRRIQVRLVGPGSGKLRVRTRPGYEAAPPGPSARGDHPPPGV